MRWYRNLYLGPNAALHIDRIRRKVAEGKPTAGVYYITLAGSPRNLFDIFHNGFLAEPLFAANQCMDVVGVAEGKMEALRLIQRIVEDIYGRTKGFDVRSYFKEQDFVKD